MTTPQRSWGIQIAAAAMTGAAVWALLAWIGFEPALLSGVLVSVIGLAGYRWWPGVNLLMAAAFVLQPLSAQRALTATPQLTIDGVEHDFSRVSRLAVSARGGVAVAQPQDNRILFFDSRGAPAGTFGRAGEGPGEFRTIGLLGWLGDTLAVADTRVRRITWIGPAQTLLRTVPTPQEILPPGGAGGAALAASVFPLAALPDGGITGTVILRRGGSFPAWITLEGDVGSAFVTMDAAGRYRRLLAMRGSIERCSVSDANSVMVIPYCFQPMDAISPNGHRVVTMTPGELGSYRVVSIDGSSGDTVFSRQFTYHPVPVSKHVADSTRDSRGRMPGGPPGMAERWRRVPVAETFPGLARLHVGNDGTVWLQEYTRAPANHRWRVLDANGVLIGVLAVPRNVQVAVVSRDQVWAIVEDEDEVQDVVRYAVRE